LALECPRDEKVTFFMPNKR